MKRHVAVLLFIVLFPLSILSQESSETTEQKPTEETTMVNEKSNVKHPIFFRGGLSVFISNYFVKNSSFLESFLRIPFLYGDMNLAFIQGPLISAGVGISVILFIGPIIGPNLFAEVEFSKITMFLKYYIPSAMAVGDISIVAKTFIPEISITYNVSESFSFGLLGVIFFAHPEAAENEYLTVSLDTNRILVGLTFFWHTK